MKECYTIVTVTVKKTYKYVPCTRIDPLKPKIYVV